MGCVVSRQLPVINANCGSTAENPRPTTNDGFRHIVQYSFFIIRSDIEPARNRGSGPGKSRLNYVCESTLEVLAADEAAFRAAELGRG